MRHKIKLSVKEKIRRWLELCDFSFKLMQRALTPKELAKRLREMREEHLKRDSRILRNLAKVK